MGEDDVAVEEGADSTVVKRAEGCGRELVWGCGW